MNEPWTPGDLLQANDQAAPQAEELEFVAEGDAEAVLEDF